jgi:phosphoglycolate phosphatase-like HAD superfamily hydrolase
MIHDLALKFSISLEESWVVGDRWIDILAGHRSKCQTILIENSKSWHSSGGKKSPKDLKPDYIVKSINEILKIIT